MKKYTFDYQGSLFGVSNNLGDKYANLRKMKYNYKDDIDHNYHIIIFYKSKCQSQ